MHLSIGNAPCSWGVEFADDARNPAWPRVLDETRAAGYVGIELGPVGFMPEEAEILGAALASRGLTLTAGVIFRPFHNSAKWDELRDASVRTFRALRSQGADSVVLIDSIAPDRALTAGRGAEAPRLIGRDRSAFLDRVRTIAKMGAEEYGLAVSLHAHAGGWIEFEDELEGALDAIDESILKICLDTGHSVYAGFDPVAFFRRHSDRVVYLHFKDVDPEIKARIIANRTGFYEACRQGLFCNLGQGAVDFKQLRAALVEKKFDGWATVEQDCDPMGGTSPADDAKANLAYLRSMQLA